MKAPLLITLAAATLVAGGCSTAEIDARNRRLEAKLQDMKRDADDWDRKNGIVPGAWRPYEYERPVTVPTPLQVLENRGGTLTAVPYVHYTPGVTQAVMEKAAEGKRYHANYQRVRDAHGGIYPCVVVRSDKAWIVVNQDRQPVAVGLPDPESAIVRGLHESSVGLRDDVAFTSRGLVDLVRVKERYDPPVEVPPLCPPDMLVRVAPYLSYDGVNTDAHPAQWRPNLRYCSQIWRSTSWDIYRRDVSMVGPHHADVYQINLE